MLQRGRRSTGTQCACRAGPCLRVPRGVPLCLYSTFLWCGLAFCATDWFPPVLPASSGNLFWHRACIFGERQEAGHNAGSRAGHFQGCILAAWGCIRSPNLANSPFPRGFNTTHFWAPGCRRERGEGPSRLRRRPTPGRCKPCSGIVRIRCLTASSIIGGRLSAFSVEMGWCFVRVPGCGCVSVAFAVTGVPLPLWPSYPPPFRFVLFLWKGSTALRPRGSLHLQATCGG